MNKMHLYYPESQVGFNRLLNLDDSFIGTPDYMGLAYFWHYDYRHYLRDASAYQRVRIHKMFLKLKLPVASASPQHLFVIRHVTKKQ